MLAIDLINDFRSLVETSPEGHSVDRDTLLKIFESYEEGLGEDQFGKEGNHVRMSHFYEGIRERERQIHEMDLEVYKAVNASGHSAIRSVFLMNGGASLAIAAFIGTIAAADTATVSASS